MKKPWLLVLLALAVAGVSVLFVWALLLTYVMRSLPSVVQTAMLVSLVVIAIAMCVAFVMAWRPERGRRYRAALAVMLLAGAAPFVLDVTRTVTKEVNWITERAEFEKKFQSELEAYKKDVAARIAEQKPLSPGEAQRFLDFVQGSDLTHRAIHDYSPETFTLLKQALDARIFDPNARVKGKRAVDVAEEPLFVVYYKFYLQSGATMPVKRVREREWTLFQMLIAGGANLDDPAAALLRDDVNRETAPYDPNVPGYITLK